MSTEALLLEYLSAYNRHDLNKILTFLHPDCRVLLNGQVVLQGIDTIRPTYERDFLDPQASATVLSQTVDPSDANRVRVLLQTRDGRRIDVTYVFEPKDSRRMVEHIIHSVTGCSEE